MTELGGSPRSLRGKIMYYMYDNNYLAHEGVTGMHWGVRHGPPYPLLRNAAGKLKARAQAKRKAKSEARAAKSAEEKATQHEALKKYVRENPEKLYKHKDDLTKEEIDEIMKQIEWDRRVKDISASEHARNMEKMTKGLNTVANVTGDAWRIYNNFANFRNALNSKKTQQAQSDKNKNKK